MDELKAVIIIRMTFFSLTNPCRSSVVFLLLLQLKLRVTDQSVLEQNTKPLLFCGFVGVCKHWCVFNETYLLACMHEKLKHDSEADGCEFSSVHICCSKVALN